MSPPFRWFIGLSLMAVGIAILVLVNGCSHCRNCNESVAQSWDQANLKQFDSGCPTAIYVNNRYGILELCE